MWGGSQGHAASNGGHKLIGAKEIGEWGKPTFDGFASRKDVSGLDPVFTATLLGVLGSVNEAFLTNSPRPWDSSAPEVAASLAGTSTALTQSNVDGFLGDVAGVTILSLTDMASCSHVGCGLAGVDAAALKAVNEFKMGIKAAPVMQPDSVWETSTNSLYLQKAIDESLGVVDDIDAWIQTTRDARISDLGVGYNHHGNSWSGTAAHGGQCSGSITISADGTFSDGHLTGLSYHNDADCTWVLDSGTATDITTLSLSFLDIAAGWDTITVREGAGGTGDVLAVYSGMQSPPPLAVVGPLHVHFSTDGKNQIFAEDQEAGFTAAVTFTTGTVATCPEGKYGGDCSSDYCYGKTAMTGAGNVIAEHRNSAQCYWDLTATSADQVVDLTFSAFGFEYSNDYVEVRRAEGRIGTNYVRLPVL